MRIKVTYYCEYCGESFKNEDACRAHEENCNPCGHCRNQYYVYGCEEACKYRDDGKCSDDYRKENFKAYFDRIEVS